jgi:hypothetical protein
MRHLQTLDGWQPLTKPGPPQRVVRFFASRMRGVEIAHVCPSASWLLIPLGVLDLCAYLDLCVIDLCVIDQFTQL